MALPINLNSKSFWWEYVSAVQLEAGKYLGHQPNRDKEAEIKPNATIYRPVILNHYDNSWFSGWPSLWGPRQQSFTRRQNQKKLKKKKTRKEKTIQKFGEAS